MKKLGLIANISKIEKIAMIKISSGNFFLFHRKNASKFTNYNS